MNLGIIYLDSRGGQITEVETKRRAGRGGGGRRKNDAKGSERENRKTDRRTAEENISL